MDFKEAKRLIAYAKKNGIKTLKAGDFEVTFDDHVIFPKALQASKDEPGIATRPPDPPVPSLDEINAYIYNQPDEQSELQ
jgi:hypothetical protein